MAAMAEFCHCDQRHFTLTHLYPDTHRTSGRIGFLAQEIPAERKRRKLRDASGAQCRFQMGDTLVDRMNRPRKTISHFRVSITVCKEAKQLNLLCAQSRQAIQQKAICMIALDLEMEVRSQRKQA